MDYNFDITHYLGTKRLLKTNLTTGPKIGFKASGHVEAKTHTNLRKMRQDGASRLNDGGQHRSTATMVHHT